MSALAFKDSKLITLNKSKKKLPCTRDDPKWNLRQH